jgi:MFS family permease
MTLGTALIPLLPHYVHAASLSKAGAGLLVSSFPAGGLAGALPGGALTRRLGARRCVLLGLAVASAGTFALTVTVTPAGLDAARFIQGFGGSCTWAAGLAWLAAATPRSRRATALGSAMSAAAAGALAGPALGAAAARWGISLTFAAAAAVTLLLAAASAVLAGPPRAVDRAVPVPGLALARQGFTAGLGLTMLAGAAFGAFDVLVPLRFSGLRAGALVIAGTYCAAAAAEVVLSPLAGRLTDRRGTAAAFVRLLAAAAAASVLIPFAGSAPVLAIVVAIVLPAYAALCVPANELLASAADQLGMEPAVAYGAGNLAWCGGQAAAAAGTGAVAQVAGNWPPCLILAGIAAVTCWQYRRPVRRARP